MQPKEPLSQSSSTSYVNKCSVVPAQRAPAPLMLAQGFLQKIKVLMQNTVLDGSQGEDEAVGFSFQFASLFWSYWRRKEDGEGVQPHYMTPYSEFP